MSEKPEQEKVDKFAAFKQVERNSLGLFDHLDYPANSYGFVDWRKMIPQEFLFINESWFKEHQKEVPDSIEKCDDSQILIKLAGIKWLARVRGYTSVEFLHQTVEDNGCIAKCTIQWIPNFENPEGVRYAEIGSCRNGNADVFAKSYSESIAANRAFVRCVRNFLNINVVGEDETVSPEISKEAEVATSITSASNVDPQSIFLKTAKESGLDFPKTVEFIKANCDDLNDEEVANDGDLKASLSSKSAKKLIKALKKGTTAS